MSWYRGLIRSWTARPLRLGITTGVALLGAGMLATGAIAVSGSTPTNASANYSFRTLNNPADPTFNQLLGINEVGEISGYYGSGNPGHPNKGYTLPNDGRGGNYHSENFPHSVQTQVVGLNNRGVTVGFYSTKMGLTGPDFGFYEKKGHFHTADFPTGNPAHPAVDQLLGVNDSGVAVGFFVDAHGNTHGYSYNIGTHKYKLITVPGDSNVTAAAINTRGDVAGFATKSGKTVGFLKPAPGGKVYTLNVPGSSMTQAFGVNDGDVVVGAYTVGTSSSPPTFGFTWAPGLGFKTVSDPHGVGSTLLNGLNDHDRIVGFYTDSKGNTDGFLATPKG